MKPSGIFLVIIPALLIRVSVLLLAPDALETDPDGYRLLAENLVAHGTFGVEDRSPLPLGEGQGEGESVRAEEKRRKEKNGEISADLSQTALTLTLSQRERGLEPTAYRPPLYPLLLTGCVALGDDCRAAIGVLHVMLGVATVALVWLLGHWWGLGKYGAFLAAVLVACDPILLNQSTQVMTETTATFLVAAGLAALTWASRCPTVGRALLTGFILALGALCRPALLSWAIVVAIISVLNSWRPTASGGTSHRLRIPAAFAFGVLITLSPWAIRNQIDFGRPIVTTTHGGYTLLLANNPEFYQWLSTGRWGDVWRADRFNVAWEQRKPHDEWQADRLAYAEAWQTIRRQPGMFAYAGLVRFGRFWSPLPHRISAEETLSRRLSRYAVAVWYVGEYLLIAMGLAWGLWKRDACGAWRVESGEFSNCPSPPSPFPPPLSSTWLYALLLVACLTAVHTVFWTDMRMRAPVMPVVALAAAAIFYRIVYPRLFPRLFRPFCPKSHFSL